MVISQLCNIANQILKQKGIQSTVLDTQLLLAHFLGKDKLFVLTNPDYEVKEYDGFLALVHRRAAYEPMQYILGEAEFMSLPFRVNRHTLVPRPDTEVLVEAVIQEIGDKATSFLDIGTGSGCIAVSITKYCKNARGTALDISAEALTVARDNAVRNGVEERLSFLQRDILREPVEGRFDYIVSNPPYIETEVIPTLMQDVRNYEPYTALWGGDDGLDFYRRIAYMGKELLKPDGLLAFEVGHTQSGAVTEILKKDGYKDVSVRNDLANIPRVVTARRS